MTVCCAAVLAFGLAACGSSSDGDKVAATTTGVTDGGTDGTDGTDGTGPTPEEMAAAVVVATKAAATKATEIAAEAAEMDTNDAGLGGSLPTGVTESTYEMDIERPRAGTVVKITDSALEDDDDPKFAQMMDFGDGRTMHVRDNGMGEEEVVIVSTDIDEPTATPFAEVDGQELNANPEIADADEDFQSLTVVAPTDSVNLPKIMSTAFTASTAAVLTFDSDDTNTNDEDEAFETAGTYNGAPGTYRCSGGTDCTVNINAMGEISEIGNGWIFTPDPGAKSYVADAEYLHYGFWLMRTTKDGATTYNEVETFAEAMGFEDTPIGADGLGAVTGDAMYKGGSVGVYVKNVLDNQGGIVSATSGHFSADVALTANFGGGGVPADDQFTIGGKITGFVLQHGEENDWAVGLGLADFSGRTDNDPGESGPGGNWTNTFNGVATGDSTAAPGSWNGMFHGVAGDVDHDMVDETPVVNTKPAAVVGEFNANFTDGTAAGGFGVNKK